MNAVMAVRIVMVAGVFCFCLRRMYMSGSVSSHAIRFVVACERLWYLSE